MFDIRNYNSYGGTAQLVFRIFLRFFQFVLAITVAGLYGTDLNNARKVDAYTDSKWLYAVIVAAMSAITTLFYGLPIVRSWLFFIWDAILFILWVAVFGIFGKMYIDEDPEGNGGIQRMKNAVWVDLVNMLMWFVTAVYGAFAFFSIKRGRTLHTGRATV
ncbi:hypothetical protein M501DRAFT_943109 [Patellaria atrata CBS 101060]|uniref:MARVEL domain-containing protein n=1 Tax=Patellaria atrata CBS 101060 TaxID=1346257 RepID=A0A9P4S4N9_9PEZI|nr:hypothetical protein M501DRAFT_943109 [Patellaria atrata CBS 101060]